MKRISIIGGSLYGVMLALNLKKINPGVEVIIHEKAESILASWKNISISSIQLNRGLHGIEIPRSNRFIDSLGSEFVNDNFVRIPNYKLLWLNGSLVPFRYPENSAPIKYRNEISDLPKNFEELSAMVSGTAGCETFLGLIKKCSARYSDNFSESRHLFFPWFLPENYFEDSIFLSNQSSSQVSTHYLVPKSGIFANLIKKVENLLVSNGIVVVKGSDISLQSLDQDEGQFVWASNSIGCIKSQRNSPVNKFFNNKRSLNISLYSICDSDLRKWRNKFEYIPSEILILDERCISMSRISFIDNGSPFVVLEAYHDESSGLKSLNFDSFDNVISDIFGVNLPCLGSVHAGHLYCPGSQVYEELDSFLSGEEEFLPYKVFFRYWWPINTSHAANAAFRDAKKILAKHI